MHQSRPFNSQSVHDPFWWVALCLPLKIRGIKKATWDKIFKNSRRNFKRPKRLNSSPKTPRKKEGFIEMLKN
jgi:hypothetical protein